MSPVSLTEAQRDLDQTKTDVECLEQAERSIRSLLQFSQIESKDYYRRVHLTLTRDVASGRNLIDVIERGIREGKYQ